MSDKIFSIERPSLNLLKNYFIQSLLTGPGFILIFPIMLCRYYTLRYHFDSEGIKMSWGLLFKKEINLTYSRIQDIHLTSTIVQRWLGLADIQIQTASGSAEAEIVIEGIEEYEELRNFFYQKMRGYKSPQGQPPAVAREEAEFSDRTLVLKEILDEVKKSRNLMENLLKEKQKNV